MPYRIIQMFLDNVNDYHTPLGKVGFVIDTMLVVFASSHILGVGEFINKVFTPIGVFLTAIFAAIRIIFTCASEYRAWKKRRESSNEKTE